jgi:hypothetical protein
MMRLVPGNTLQKRKLLACSILLAVLACAALPGTSQAKSHRLRGVGFSTIVPRDWKRGRQDNGAARSYFAAWAKNKPNTAVNSMVLDVTVISVKAAERQLGRKLPSSLEDIASQTLGGPQGTQAQVVVPARPTRLRGTPAASIVFQYIYNNAMLLQSDTVCIRHGRLYILELKIDTVKQWVGLPVLEKARNHWRWR